MESKLQNKMLNVSKCDCISLASFNSKGRFGKLISQISKISTK